MNFKETFETDFYPLQQKLYRYSLRMIRDSQSAEDVVQEAFIRIWNKREDWHQWENREAMAMRITRNLTLDKMKSKHNRTKDIDLVYDMKTEDMDPLEHASKDNLMKILEKALEKMTELQRSVIELRDIQGYKYKEIADILEIPLSQVKIQLHRGRLQLKKILQTQLSNEL